MKKVSLFLMVFISFCICINKVNASCSYTRMANLKKLASNVNITYTYNVTDNKALFDIRFANFNNDIYLYDSYNDKKYNINGEITLKNFADGIKYRFFIKSNDSNCKDEILSTRYVTLPKYNIFYGDPICKGIEDYTLCQKWGSFTISNYNEYIKQINKYKDSLSKSNEETIKTEETTLVQKIVSFLLKYYVVILISIIIICLTLIYYLSGKDKFDL